jgi:hypothetical protein
MTIHKDLPVSRNTVQGHGPLTAQEEAVVSTITNDPAAASHDQATVTTSESEDQANAATAELDQACDTPALAPSNGEQDMFDEDSVPPYDINNLTRMFSNCAGPFIYRSLSLRILVTVHFWFLNFFKKTS